MELTYDANGNLKSYGDKQYTWNYGKSLGTVTDGDNTYAYAYDENGIRTSKTVNGVTTEINTVNGKVLAQKTGEDILYFLYDSSDVPVGFVYNDAAYYYITNISNDVVGITDSAGNIIAEYEYDEWGKLISVEAESEEAQAIAQMNPLRYRGYYYDNETGYYYLQSRYYNPGLGRFISADDFAYVDASGKFSINAYAYCANNPVNFSDPSGHISITINPDEKTSSVIVAVFKGLSLAIRLDAVSRFFEGIVQIFNKSFNFNKWFIESTKTVQDIISSLFLYTSIAIQKIFDRITELFDINKFFDTVTGILGDFTLDNIIDLIADKLYSVKSGSGFFNLWKVFSDSFNRFQSKSYTFIQSMESFILNAAYVFASILMPENVLLLTILNIISNAILDTSFDFDNGRYWG